MSMQTQPYVRKVHFYETDAMGVVHHANYIRWLEEARVDYMEKIGFGYDRATARGVDIAVLNVQCTYHAMVRFGGAVCVSVAITELSPARMRVAYEVKDADTGTLCATGHTQHCFICGGKPVALKKALPELYAVFERERTAAARA